MAELADRLAQGDPAAFAELYDVCADRLHYWLARHLGSASDADDVVQDAFVRLARNRAKLAGVANLTAYVFTIARNEAARLQTARARETRKLTDRPAVEPSRSAGETTEMLTKALARLPVEQRAIVELKTFAGLTLREIAEVTDLPPGTVATRYRAALGQLRIWLAEIYP